MLREGGASNNRHTGCDDGRGRLLDHPLSRMTTIGILNIHVRLSTRSASNSTPIHPEGYPFVGGFALASLVLFWLWPPLGWLATLATVWCAYFFRDPPRVTPVRDGIVVAPADGRVSQIVNAVPPKELDLGERPLPRISIFMSVFDCHVNRSPVAGRIERIVYRAGKFLSADLDKASEDNERNALRHRDRHGPAHRGDPDRRPRRPADRSVRARGRDRRRRPAHRHDPVRLARRCLSARGQPRAGRPRARPRSPAKPCSPISRRSRRAGRFA